MTDPDTLKRLTNLAIVGDFLFEISNELSEDMDYFLAKSSLKEFEEDIAQLGLDMKVNEGVGKLIKYLDKKIEKRRRQAGGEVSQD